MAQIWLGLDVGTTAIKAAAYTQDGRRVAITERPNEVLRASGDRAEQDMAAVWNGAAACLRLLATDCADHSIISLGVCAQGDGLWALDAQGRPVRPAMLWNDTRASADVQGLMADGTTGKVGLECHTALWPGSSAALWRWLRTAEPEAAARVSHVMTCADWITFNLTAERATDFSNGTIPFMDIASRGYSAATFNALACEDLAGRLFKLRPADSLLGTMTPKAAAQTGLPAGLPVSVGTLDLAAMIVGMSMDQPGQTMMIMGTTAVVNILTDRVVPSETPVGATVMHPTAGLAIRVLAPSTGAAAFDWFASLHTLSLGGETPSVVAGKLNALIVNVPVGANGVTFLPYLNGERAPFVAPDIRGMLHGLSASTTKADIGRAVMEGAALSLRHCFEKEGGLPTAPVQLTGGGSRNAVWSQMIADIIGQPMIVTANSDQGLWGAACIGAAAAGLGPVISLTRRHEETCRFDPDPERKHQFDQVYRRYAVLSSGHRRMQQDLNHLLEIET